MSEFKMGDRVRLLSGPDDPDYQIGEEGQIVGFWEGNPDSDVTFPIFLLHDTGSHVIPVSKEEIEHV